MRYDKVLASFAVHPEWYPFVKGVEIAPPDAVEAMNLYNSYGFHHTTECDLQKFFEGVRADVDRRKTIHS